MSDTTDETLDEVADDLEGQATPVPPPKTTLTLTIDGAPHEAEPGQLVIDACLDAGAYVPHFCYHPRMSPVGMCRQCLVEVEGPRGPMLVVSCMTPVAEGQVVSTEADGVKRAQEGVLELLLANHPLDCPVCDKGGECPLQDQAMSHGPGESRYVEEKRHYEKPIAISDLVFLDRERCILCDRCTRFADEVAGDPLISFTHRGNNTQVLTFPDEPFSSYFSGNTVQICPVGALTAKPYRFKARPWDLEEVESTCTTCSVGCRVSVQSSRNEVVRLQGVDSDPVNWGWLCDRGRFSFEALRSPDRLTHPLVRTEAGMAEVSWTQAIHAAAGLVRDALDESGPAGVAVLGGARGTNEDAHAWALLAGALGIDQLDPQLDDGLSPAVFTLPQATIDQAAAASTIVLLAPDLKEELPVLYLRLRDAAEKRRSRILEVTTRASGLSRYAWQSHRALPGQHASVLDDLLRGDDVREQLGRGDVVVVVGRANLAEAPEHTLAALRSVLQAAPGAKLLPVLRRGNVRGALAAGLVPASGGTRAILEAAATGRVGCLVLLGADPLADVPDTDLARRALAGVRRIVAVDTFMNASSSLAHVVLPAAAYAEKAGTTTNLEGRITPVAKRVTVRGTARPDWMIAVDLAEALGHDLGLGSLEDVQASLAARQAGFASVFDALAGSPDGVLLAHDGSPALDLASLDVPAVGERNSYDYRLVVGRRLYDRAVGTQQSPSLAPLAPAAALHVHPLDLDRLGVTEGQEVKVSGPRSTVVMPVTADPAVMRGSVWASHHQAGPAVSVLVDASASIVDVRVENLA